MTATEHTLTQENLVYASIHGYFLCAGEEKPVNIIRYIMFKSILNLFYKVLFFFSL